MSALRWFFVLSLAFLPVCVSVAGGDEFPQSTDVYTSGEDGYFAYRIPAVATSSEGTLLALAEARKNNLSDPGGQGQEIHLVVKRSEDAGRSWSEMQVIENAGELWSAANPSVVVDRDTGRIWVIYVRCKPGRGTHAARPGTDDAQTRARYSDDDGRTWSESIDLTAIARDMDDPHWNISVPGPGGAIQTSQGRLVIPCWRYPPFSNFVLYSDDHGQTWKRGKQVPGDQQGDECQVVELADGRLLMDIRQHGPHRWLSESDDGGITWSEPRPGPEVTPVMCAIERFTPRDDSGGRNRIVWTAPRGPGRQDLTIWTSYDEGRTFQNPRLIYEGPSAYSDLTTLADGTVGILWERGEDRGYQFITFTRVDLSFLEPR